MMNRRVFFKTVAVVAGAPVADAADKASEKKFVTGAAREELREYVGTVEYHSGQFLMPHPMHTWITASHNEDRGNIIPGSIVITGHSHVIRDDGAGNLYIVKEQHD